MFILTVDFTFMQQPVVIKENDLPSLVQLMDFPFNNIKVNIIQQLGTSYRELDTRLLNDHTGAITDAIIMRCHDNVLQINFKVLQRWIEGNGRKPTTWKVLVDVLENVNPKLASIIGTTLT